MTDLLLEHSFPRALIVAAIAGAILLGSWSVWRYLRLDRTGWLLLGLRLLFLVGLGWCLLQPMRRATSATALKPRFIVLLDTSASMARPRAGGTTPTDTRWQVATQLLEQDWLERIADRAVVEIIPFDADLAAAVRAGEVSRLEPNGLATALGGAAQKVVDRFRGQTLAGVLLLSDGLETRAAGRDWVTGEWPCPMYTVRLEPPSTVETPPDVRVERVETSRRVVVGWASKLTASIAGEGTQGRALTVQLFAGETLTQEEPTQLPAEGGRREVAFTLPHPEIGQFTYTVFVPPLAGELVTNDNVYAISVQVVDTKNRLLYVEGPPRFESKFLTRVLQSSPAVSPLIFLQGANQQFLVFGQRDGMTTAMTPEDLTQFKIVILGDLDATALGAERAQALTAFVEQGGSLVLLGGARAWGSNGFAATALQSLLPVQREGFQPPREGRFTVEWTAEGKAHPAFAQTAEVWAAAPPVLTLFPGSTLAPGAVALAQTSDGDPLLVAQRFGQGKVAAVLTDSLWRWRLEPSTDDFYARFWNQLLDWMTPKQGDLARYELDLFADTDQLWLGDPIRLAARLGAREERALSGISVDCRIQTPEGRSLVFPMSEQPVTTSEGRQFPGYGVEFTGQVPGLYTATATTGVDGQTIESAPYSFFIKPFTPESQPRPLDADLLAGLAQASGGRFLEPDEVNRVLGGLELEGGEEARVEFASLWNAWPVLACLVGLLTLEWIVRKANNLP